MRHCLRDPTFSRIDTIPECDRHTHTHTHRHTTTANTALSIASRGKNHQFFWLTVSRGSRLMSISIFGKIGQSYEEILTFFNFKNGGRRHLGFFEIAKYYWQLWQRGSRHISMPNFVKIGQSFAKILRFFPFFQDGGRRHLGL